MVGGYDFVGEGWPIRGPCPRSRPTDRGLGAGHGTHVADIIGGKSANGLHEGVAPGATCMQSGAARVSTSCPGIALLQGIDFALDPNGDNDISDAVDAINLSWAQAYGQTPGRPEGAACANAVEHLGVVVVASAGNNADKEPYIVGSPSHRPAGDQRGPDAGPERQGLSAGRERAGLDRRHLRQHRDGRVGPGRRGP